SYPIASVPSLSLSSSTTYASLIQSVSTSSTVASVSTAPHPVSSSPATECSSTSSTTATAAIPLSSTASTTPGDGVCRPTLPELLRLEIPEGIATSHTTFGIFLLNDETGDKVDFFRDKHRGNPKRISRSILQEWLRGKGLPVTWETLVKALSETKLFALADKVQAANIPRKSPDIRGVDIIEQTKIEISPDQPLDYHWEGHGFKVQIPAGAIGLVTKVTTHIRASLSGEYKLPDDKVLVSEVFWLSLDPPVETFDKKVTLALQHCASDDDSTLTFITSTQDKPPYTFLPLPGGSFSESGHGTIDVDHFLPFGLIARRKSYAFCTFYLPIEKPKTHEVHITVTPNLKIHLKEVNKVYRERRGEKGLEIQACLKERTVSLHIPDIGIPERTWEKDGWNLTPLTSPSLEKRYLEGYKPGRSIPFFAIKLEEISPRQRLVQKVLFTGVEETKKFLSIGMDMCSYFTMQC
ncbi:hypothetical protein GBAR_LOCUS24750, partial [Geodia barretti]